MKRAPAYAVASVDHALRLAVVLQLEGSLTVTAAAERLDVARSTAHRLLQTLCFRDFAVQDEDRSYRVGPVLELSARSTSGVARLRAAALQPLAELVDMVGETANLSVRTGATVRFVASVECSQALRVGSREGMAFPAHLVTGGLVLLATLSNDQVRALYSGDRVSGASGESPDVTALLADLRAVRRTGAALNTERSEKGLVALGRGVIDRNGDTVAAVSVSLPSVRHRKERVPEILQALGVTAEQIASAL